MYSLIERHIAWNYILYAVFMYTSVFTIQSYIHVVLPISIHPCIYTYMYSYVTEVSINVVGMNTFLFPMEFLHFGRKIPSLLHF